MNSLTALLLALLAISAASRPVPTPRRTLITGGSAVAGSTLYEYGAKLQACVEGESCSTFCSAVIVGQRAALTAAHCIETANKFTADREKSFIAVLSENANGDEERIVVGGMHVPPEYNTTPLGHHDFAFLALESVVSVGKIASVVDAEAVIARTTTVDADTEASFEAGAMDPIAADPVLFAVGSGLTKYGVTVPAGRTTEEALADQTTPNDFTPGVPNVAEYTAQLAPDLFEGAIAARALESGHVICFGDSGGPLLALGTGGEISVVGIATESIMNSESSCGIYAVYTEVSNYKKFIDGVVSVLGSEFDVVYKPS